MKNRRRSRRFLAKKKVMLGETEPRFLASTLNISKNGIAVESNQAFFPDSRVIVKLYSKGWVMILEGVVKWMRPDVSRTFYKIGIKLFEIIHKSTRLSLH
ncbi:MAG: PilZ domain-containing protein [Deltaproteobacteria bacterium]|nr:PilZ domain-containing protein [Deltaproteobacteria bacterium]